MPIEKRSKKEKLSEWLAYEDARSYIHSLGLRSQAEWNQWRKSGARPVNIPAKPERAYKDKGWVSWGDWLGTGRIANQNKVYLPFDEARKFAQTLRLRSVSDWDTWTKNNKLPQNIPSHPRGVYKKDWAGWGDWLGTDRIANQKRSYRSFSEARAFARQLKLKSQIEWREWIKNGQKPNDIPSKPDRIYKEKGWISWGDWLGTKNKKVSFRQFVEAKIYVRNLKLKSQAEWNKWVKSGNRPEDIPTNPQATYKKDGWISWGDWLGTRNRKGNFRPFEKAREFARSLKLKDQAEWVEFAKSNERPDDIPIYPDVAYKNKGWTVWGDWLGTSRRRSGHRPFRDARAFVHKLELQSKDHWNKWAKSKERPLDIPASPERVYKNKGWLGWGDWLGTGRIAPQDMVYRPFKEARAFVRKQGLKNRSEWNEWAKSNLRPMDIPVTPERIYKNEGWLGVGDWLGIVNVWNRNAILSFLYNIKPILKNLQPSELYAIMRQNGMIASSVNLTNTNSGLLKSLRDIFTLENPETDFEKLVTEIEKQNQVFDEDLDEETELEIVASEGAKDELPGLRSLTSLKAVDVLVEAGITSDEETIEFLVANRVSGLWQDVLNKGLAAELENLRNDTGGLYFNTIRSRFLSQYDGAQGLVIPAGYDFRVEGKLAQPNLMQRLAAYRILTEKRLGNWSGVGAGKTLSAILASRVIDARLTIIVAFNSTIQPWATRIKEAFPDSAIYIKERGNIRVDPAKHTYLVLNFETFQQPDSLQWFKISLKNTRLILWFWMKFKVSNSAHQK